MYKYCLARLRVRTTVLLGRSAVKGSVPSNRVPHDITESLESGQRCLVCRAIEHDPARGGCYTQGSCGRQAALDAFFRDVKPFPKWVVCRMGFKGSNLLCGCVRHQFRSARSVCDACIAGHGPAARGISASDCTCLLFIWQLTASNTRAAWQAAMCKPAGAVPG